MDAPIPRNNNRLHSSAAFKQMAYDWAEDITGYEEHKRKQEDKSDH